MLISICISTCEKHFANAREEIKRRSWQMHCHIEKRHNERWYTWFLIVSGMNTIGHHLTNESIILWVNVRKSSAVGAVDVYWWIKFSNSWHKQLFQMSQYLLGNNTFSHMTTFVNESNTFYQHVDRSPRIWLWGPHKGSQAKLQYFSKRPLVFYSLSLFECFLKVFNLHPNAVPLFNLIYNADAEAIRMTEVHPQERHRRKIIKINKII